MVSLENTEIAFENKSDRDLKRSYKLFKLVGNSTLVKFGYWFTNIALKLRLPIKGIIKKTIFKQFCGGETIEECNYTIKQLYDSGIGTILDYSVEGNLSKDDFMDTVDELISTIEKAKDDVAIPFTVFKITAIADFNLLTRVNSNNAVITEADSLLLNDLENRVDKICGKAHECDVPLFIDAEESWIQDVIDRICITMMKRYNKVKVIVFNTVQMYRHDRLAFLKEQINYANENNFKYGVKLVRGAYMLKERARAKTKGYPSPIHSNKEASDRDYNLALHYSIDHLDVVSFCAATHNEQSSKLLADLIKEKGIAKNDERIYFAQLLGMSDNISYNLSNAHYNVAKYVPYGPVKKVLPYLIRRANENTSVAGQTGREITLIKKEITRRKNK